jgi:choline dehydrogenase-like flavoprotein
MSSENHPAGLGNRHDIVGRFFSEHPHIYVGVLVYARPAPGALGPDVITGTGQLAEGFRLTDRFQQMMQISDAAFWPLQKRNVEEIPELGDDPAGRFAQDLLSRLAGTKPAGPRRCTVLSLTVEQSPNPRSRISLGENYDALGMRRVRLDWSLSELDRRTFATALKAIGCEAGRQRIGRFWLQPALRQVDLERPDSIRLDIPVSAASNPVNQLDSELRWGCHHMGATRMHADPQKGVVDPHLRMHGIANLYMAGSSVFSNAGISNPTLTIIALALRLADHIKTL